MGACPMMFMRSDDFKCLKEECEWWMPIQENCAIFALANVAGIITDTVVKFDPDR